MKKIGISSAFIINYIKLVLKPTCSTLSVSLKELFYSLDFKVLEQRVSGPLSLRRTETSAPALPEKNPLMLWSLKEARETETWLPQGVYVPPLTFEDMFPSIAKGTSQV